MTTPTTDDFVGLADIIYKRTDLANGSSLTITALAIVLDVINHSSPDGYYGALLRDDSTNTLFVVDRGTDPKNWQDMATDIVMAGTNQNAQWQDADALAQFVSQYATTNGSVIYTVGHSGWHARRCRRRSREIRGRGMILGIDVISPPRWDAHRDREFM